MLEVTSMKCFLQLHSTEIASIDAMVASDELRMILTLLSNAIDYVGEKEPEDRPCVRATDQSEMNRILFRADPKRQVRRII